MREIIFRGINRVAKKMMYWGFVFDEELKAMVIIENHTQNFWQLAIPETVGQYTGLKDKNGKMIFEGDRVKWLGHEVIGGKQARIERVLVVSDFIKDSYKLICITEGTGQLVEIVGNIHEEEKK